MKKLFLSLAALIGIGCFTACSNDEEMVVQNDGVPVTIRATIANDTDTRVALGESDGNKTKVIWSEDDKFMLTVNNTSYEFTRTTTGESSDADFTCNGFPATFPATGTITATYPTTKVNYASQDGSKEKVGDYITLNATREVTEGESAENLNLTFKHNTSVVRMYLTNQDFKDKAVTVSLSATNLLADGTTITTTNTALTGNDDGTVEAYLVVPATDADKTLADFKITAVCDDINYETTLTATKLEAKKLYRVTKDMEKVVVATVTDLSPLVEGETGKYKTANCYIVTGAGDYKFRATHMGNSHADEHALAIDHVAVLWETFGTSTQPSVGDLVKNTAYADGYISFTASEKKGNALIAAYNSSNEIVWSWHIWMTDQPQEHQYVNSSGQVVGTMMDRNLGATSAIPSDGVATYGLFYQWGRKDPFMGACVTTGNKQDGKAASTGTWTFQANSENTGTIEFSIKNPTYFLGRSSTKIDGWCWENQGELWAETKTIYDPSPYGWKIPATTNNIWSEADMSNQEVDETNKGRVITNNGNDIWYPFAGILGGNQYGAGYGGLNVVASSGYYHVTLTNNRCYAYSCSDKKNAMSSDGAIKSAGHSIRCMKE